MAVDAGPSDAGCDCSERKITFGLFEGLDTVFTGQLTMLSEVFLVGLG